MYLIDIGVGRNGKMILTGSFVEHIVMGRGIARGTSITGHVNWQDLLGFPHTTPAVSLTVVEECEYE